MRSQIATAFQTKIENLKSQLGRHDVQLNGIYEAIENLLDDKSEKLSHRIDRPRPPLSGPAGTHSL